MKPLCADVRLWGGKPPKEYYIPTEKLTVEQSVKFKAWQDSINKKWDWMSLVKYLIRNDIATSQNLSDEELNQFRRDL